MKISIAMCTYKGAEFLRAQLESIIAQSRPPDELVICDDGSSDDTRPLLERFAAESFIPITLHFNEQNLGSIKNFEEAISLCTGDIVALSDQDDVWRSDKLKLIEDAFKESPSAGLVFSDAEIVDENLKPLNRRMWDEVGFDAHKRKLVRTGRALEVLIPGWTVTGATMAFRSPFVKLSLPIPEGIAMIHDGWIALTIAAVADVVALDEPLIQYRQHGRQQIGAPARKHAAPELRGRQAIETAFRRRNSNADLHKILETLEARLLAHASDYDTHKALSFVGDYAFHLNVRANLPQRRLNRVPRILRELISLRYHEYANGFKSAAKDLVS
ncbi:MAG TPA: glycosyltransferase family 2 protein [Pyrinomonadaceae bacterium]|nr:glycosyltransferase family 2 protein [Pyrinomonadaceae bacterium]